MVRPNALSEESKEKYKGKGFFIYYDERVIRKLGNIFSPAMPSTVNFVAKNPLLYFFVSED